MWVVVGGGRANGTCLGNEVQIGEDLHMVKTREKRQIADPNVVGLEMREDNARAGSKLDCSVVKMFSKKCRGDESNSPDTSSDMTEPLRPAVQAAVVPTLVSTSSLPEVHKTILDKVRAEHDMAKAIKADDAQVPVYLWDEAVCGREPTDRESKAPSTLQYFLLRVYRRRLWREIRSYMASKFGQEWLASGHAGENRGTKLEVEAIDKILWRAAENKWFEYPLGSTSLYFRSPSRFRMQALEGVRVYYTDEGPMSKWRQPPVGEEEKQVLHKKISQFINRRYIAPIPGKFESSIIYFAVPKGNDNWRIVFHAGANKLNDCIWALLFCLPSINLLLRIIDGETLMLDRDMGDMFHNFPLHANTVKFTAIDLAPLDFGPEDYKHWWVCWKQNLMGFRSLPYNSVQTYLVAEEIIRGDRHDHTNAFQWSSIMLNLLGTSGYQPSAA
jgi:hypothetical protein